MASTKILVTMSDLHGKTAAEERRPLSAATEIEDENAKTGSPFETSDEAQRPVEAGKERGYMLPTCFLVRISHVGNVTDSMAASEGKS